MSYKAEMKVVNDDKWYSNNLCFGTHREAEAYALELLVRWTNVVGWRIVESDERVNYKIVDGKTVPI